MSYFFDEDADQDLVRDDFEERELNAGGARAARIRRLHDCDACDGSRVYQGELCPQCS